MTAKQVPRTLTAIATIAALTLRRLVRGRALWVSFLIAGVPVVYAAAMSGAKRLGAGDELFVFETLVIAVLAPMFIASSIGEELEDRTMTYLWSRPVPRWSVLAGKLVALAPLAIAIVVASWTVASYVAWKAPPTVSTCAALAGGTLVMSMLATGLATLSPRHGMALSIVYVLFFDAPLGVLPATLRELSVTHQIRALSGLWRGESNTEVAIIALAAMACVWLGIAALRIRRLEA